MHQTRIIEHDGTKLIFAVPNALNEFRADTFSTKEPETLDWIDGFPEGSVLWDIGANVGLYSCYAATRRRCRVFAFEPSVFNLETLARNIFSNGLSQRITIIPLAVSDSLKVSELSMSSTEMGAALSSFSEAFGHDGKPLQPVFTYSTLGISMTDASTLLGLAEPDFVKLDVDGIEHLILRGGSSILDQVQGVLVEINEAFPEQLQEATRHLEKAGLVLVEKRHWEQATGGPHEQTFNQIWRRLG